MTTPALCAIAMYHGAALTPAEWQAYAEQQGFGMLEAWEELAELAGASEAILMASSTLEHPGVYAYEVSEVVGRLYGDMVRSGTVRPESRHELLVEELMRLARNFFFKRCPENLAQLRRSAELGDLAAVQTLEELGL